jgi:UDP-GlcNAc:undecaprenyl-phosphate GlcNAc-1-phosphate transferase
LNEKPDAKGSRQLRYLLLLAFACLVILPLTKGLFSRLGARWAYILIVSTALSFLLTPLFRWAAFKLNIIDKPESRKVHLTPTPLLGGAAVFVSFTVAIIINGVFSIKLVAILSGSAVLFSIGVADDFMDIPASIKLMVQIICAFLVISCGIILRVVPTNLGTFSIVSNVLLTLFWIVGITNAMNFFDGMDGMAAGLGAIISFFLGIMAFQTGQTFLGWISVAMVGSCIGFLPYNFLRKGRATIFLGDAGSTIIGFIPACLAVYGDWAVKDPVIALVSPLLIFWILIFDMIYITVDRILSGKVKTFREWIDYVGKDHLHHRLSNVLGGHKKSVLFIYLLSFCLGTSAIVLRNARPVDALLLLIQASIMVILISILERRGRSNNGE